MIFFAAEKLNKINALRRFAQALPLLFCLCLAAFAFAAPAKAAAAAKGDILVLTVHEGEKAGKVFIRLRPDLAPKHIAQIKKLVADGAYNNVVFHRVIAGFMAQTGDVQYGNRSRYDDAAVGQGGSKYPNIPAEFSQEAFKRGTVGMARAASPDSANSQFFICYGDAGFLNGQYTIIGTVVKGMEFIDGLKKGSAADNGKVEGSADYIIKAELGDKAS